MQRVITLLCVLLLTPLSIGTAGAVEVNPYPPKLSADGKLGIIGPSLAAGTNSSQMCDSEDSVQCIENVLGVQSREWSHAGGNKSWSIASLLGFDADHVVDASDDGEEWKDALGQASTIMADPQVEAVFIILGGNNVCAPFGHDYTGDLTAISAHIDETLLFLTDTLPAGGRIYWSGVLDVTQLRSLMADRDHNYWFENCQAFWDLDGEKIKDSAANDICDHYFDHRVCQAASAVEEAKDRVLELVLDRALDSATVREGPCGKVLNSRSTAQDVEEARQFTLALNALMASKAQQYNGRNDVTIYYNDNLFSASAGIKPYYVSRLDCFHPNRTGQQFLASEIWRGFNPNVGSLSKVFFDEFDSQDYCAQEFPSGEGCWTEVGEADGPLLGDIQINLRELRVQNNNRGLEHRLNLKGLEEAWLSFNWRREDLDQLDDYASLDISPDGGQTWHFVVDWFRGDADDFNMHRGSYYDISPYATADTLIRFIGSSSLGDQDKVFFDNVKVSGWYPVTNQALQSAILPASRSVQVGSTATAFAALINSGDATATGCAIAPLTSVAANFSYQTMNAAGAPIGSPDTPVDIPAGALQTFVLAFTPTAPFDSTDVSLNFTCDAVPAPIITGVNTLLLSASATPVPDIIALAATASGDGIVRVPGAGASAAFAVATANTGSGGLITASADTGSTSLPLALFLCETQPGTGACQAPPAASVTTNIAAGATPGFAVFVVATGDVPFDPAGKRVFVRFKDSQAVTRGATSVAVTTAP